MIAHLPNQFAYQAMHDRILCTQQMRMPHGAAHDPAQHVAASLVRRHDAFGDQERGRAQVICDHPMMDIALAVRIGGGRVGRCLDQGPHRIGVVVVVLALQKRADTLQPHARIDRLHVERLHRAVLELLVLHEDHVPDLDEPVAILLRRSRRPAPDMIAMVVEDFRTGPAWACRPHLPEIVAGRDADDPVFRHPDLLPDFEGLVVGVIDRRQKA